MAVHVGDIKSGSTECSDAWYVEMARQFDGFEDPLIYSIGDNEWTDCHRANDGGYDPIGRLAKIRYIFFASPGEALGGRGKRVDAEDAYPENQRWQESRVTFATFHVIGSNNGRDPWFGLFGVTPPANVTQILVDRSIEDDIDWLRLHVDQRSPEVFSWEQVFVP